MQFASVGYAAGNSSDLQWETYSYAHDGYPGWRTDELLPISDKPSIASATLVHAGTNDFAQSKPVDQAFSNLVNIVVNLLQKSEDAQVFVAQIIPVTEAAADFLKSKDFTKLCKCPATTPTAVNTAITAYNEKIASDLISEVEAALPEEENVADRVGIVDMSRLLNAASDYSDGVHPNIRGYCKMALQWQQSVYNAPLPPIPEGKPTSVCDQLPVADLQAMQQGKAPPMDSPPPAWDRTPRESSMRSAEAAPGAPEAAGSPEATKVSESFLEMLQPSLKNPGRVRERVRER